MFYYLDTYLGYTGVRIYQNSREYMFKIVYYKCKFYIKT